MSNDMPNYEDEKILPAEQDYKAEITGFGEVRPSSRGSHVFLPINIDIKGLGSFTQYMAVHIPVLEMLKQAEDYYKHREVMVRIRHRQHEDRMYLDVSIIWESLV